MDIVVGNTCNTCPLTLNFTDKTSQGYSANSQPLLPCSKQVRYVKDINNTILNANRYFSGVSDSQGSATIFFVDLNAGSGYVVYMTASNMLPYEPAILLNDTEVGVLSFHTIDNPNNSSLKLDLNSDAVDMLESSNQLLQDLIIWNPSLGWAIKKYLDESNNKLTLQRR